MADHVETIASIAPPWGILGTHVEPGATPKEMMVAAGLDWRVDKVQASIALPDPNTPGVAIMKPINRAALIRSTDRKELDNVPLDWNPLQNEEAFEFFLDFVEKGNMEMHTAGQMRDGKLVWALARIREAFTIGENDVVQSHLLFTNPHQFGKAIDIRFMPLRIRCWNSLSLSLGKKGLTVDQQVVKASHRKPFDKDRVLNTLGEAHKLFDEYKDAALLLAARRYSQDDLDRFFRIIFPKHGTSGEKSRNHIQALGLMDTQPGADSAPGTWWQAFNVVTYMTDHVMGRSRETRLDSAWFGSNRDTKSKALNTAVALAKASGAN